MSQETENMDIRQKLLDRDLRLESYEKKIIELSNKIKEIEGSSQYQTITANEMWLAAFARFPDKEQIKEQACFVEGAAWARAKRADNGIS